MENSPIYCTWSHRTLLPPMLHDRFRDLDHFVMELVSSAKSRLLIIVPYLSPAGLSAMRAPLAASARRGAWIRMVTGDLDDAQGWNRLALRRLVDGEEGSIIRGRLRILAGAGDLSVPFHAKIIVADKNRGYLGSANLSWSALEKNFEVGVGLEPYQAKALDDLASFFESQGLLKDQTELAFQE